MAEEIDAKDKLISLNGELDLLGKKYKINEGKREQREANMKVLSGLGVSETTITVIRAANTMFEIVNSFDDPTQTMQTEDVIPTVTRVVKGSLELAAQDGIDPRLEMSTAAQYLDHIHQLNNDNQLSPNLTNEYQDTILDPLRGDLSLARELV